MVMSFGSCTTAFVMVVAMSLTPPARALSTDLIRGGQGLIFSDSNGFNNPGENALNYGSSVEVSIARTLSSGNLAVGPSFSHSNRSFAWGAFYQRSGTSLLSSSGYGETFGGALGGSFNYRRLTAGLGYRTYLFGTLPSSSNLYGVATLHLTKKMQPSKGFFLAAAFNQALGIPPVTTSYTAAFGYSLRRNYGYEIDYSLNDIYNIKDMSVGGYFLYGTKRNYFGGGYRFDFAGSGRASARVGWIREQNDYSLTASYGSPSNTYLGAAIRTTF